MATQTVVVKKGGWINDVSAKTSGQLLQDIHGKFIAQARGIVIFEYKNHRFTTSEDLVEYPGQAETIK